MDSKPFRKYWGNLQIKNSKNCYDHRDSHLESLFYVSSELKGLLTGNLVVSIMAICKPKVAKMVLIEYPSRMILAFFDLQVAPILPTKCWPW